MKTQFCRSLFFVSFASLAIFHGPTKADLITSTLDPFEGAQVVASNQVGGPVVPGSSNVFLGANPETESTSTFFSDVGAGNTSFVNFTSLATDVKLVGVHLFARHDSAVNGYRRSMSNFRLLADLNNDLSYETVLVDEAISIPYDLESGNLASETQDLLMKFTFPEVIANSFRAEFVQGVDFGNFDGVRVRELDAIGTAVPEPSPLVIFALLTSALVAVVKIKKRMVA